MAMTTLLQRIGEFNIHPIYKGGYGVVTVTKIHFLYWGLIFEGNFTWSPGSLCPQRGRIIFQGNLLADLKHYVRRGEVHPNKKIIKIIYNHLITINFNSQLMLKLIVSNPRVLFCFEYAGQKVKF